MVVPKLGIKPAFPKVEVSILNHWAARQVPDKYFLIDVFLPTICASIFYKGELIQALNSEGFLRIK